MNLSRRHFLRCAAAGTAAAFLGQAAAAKETSKRPNIVLILADDMGYSDLGCYGGEIDTPHLDALAANGLRFTQFYNCAKCEPTRASLLTGLYSERAGRGIQRGVTMGHVLREAGYATLACGKWHLNGAPEFRGFDRAFGHLSGASNYFEGNQSWHLDGEPYEIPEDFYATDAITNYALRFMREEREKAPKKPFFLYLAYNAPHCPLQAPEELIGKYRGRYREGWEKAYRERYQRQLELGIIDPDWPVPGRPDYVRAWDSLSEEQRDFEDFRMATYAAMVDRMDQGIGRLVAQLRESGELENTLLLFLSDNGACPYDRTNDIMREQGIEPGGPDSRWERGVGIAWMNNTPLRYHKRYQHEGGVCTPLIAHWPEVIDQGGKITHEPGHIIDLLPTFTAITGVDYAAAFEGKPSPPNGVKNPKTMQEAIETKNESRDSAPIPPLDGESLLPLIKGEQPSEEESLRYHFINHRAIREGDWKLVSGDGRPWELYRLDRDRMEVNDLSQEHPEMVEELNRKWENWHKDVNGGKAYENYVTDPGDYTRNPKRVESS